MVKYMKKTLLLVCGCLFLTGCSLSELPFITGTEITVDENTYEVYSIKKNGIIYQVEKGLFAKDKVTRIIEEMEEELKAANEILAPDKSHEYTVRIMQTTPKGGMYIEDDVLYIRGKDIEKGRYLPWLIQMDYQLQDTWVAFGIFENLKNETGEIDLAQYFIETEDVGLLGFFPGRFVTYINYESDYKVAAYAAKEFFNYCMEQGKSKELLNGGITVEDKQAWLASLETGLVYDGKEDEIFKDAKKLWTAPRRLYIELDEGTYDITFVDVIENGRGVEDFIVGTIRGKQEGCAFLKEYYDVDASLGVMNFVVKPEGRYTISKDESSGAYNIFLDSAAYPESYGLLLAIREFAPMLETWKMQYFVYFWIDECLPKASLGGEKYYYADMKMYMDNLDDPDFYDIIAANEHGIWDDYMNLNLSALIKKDVVDLDIYYDLQAMCVEGYNIDKILQIKKPTPIEKIMTTEVDSLIRYIYRNYGKESVIGFLVEEKSLLEVTGKSETTMLVDWREYLKTTKDEWYREIRENMTKENRE